MGDGEETAYIVAWGAAFAIDTFGLESVKIIGRKALFILIIDVFKASFGSAKADALFWYESYTELAGTQLLVETSASGLVARDVAAAGGDAGGGDDADGATPNETAFLRRAFRRAGRARFARLSTRYR